jgi:hypothetical protein
LTLGIAVGVPAVATRFPGLLGGENGLMIQVPYPAGGYVAPALLEGEFGGEGLGDTAGEEGGLPEDEALFEELPDEFFQEDTGDELLTDEDFTLLDEGDSAQAPLTDEDLTLLDGGEALTEDDLTLLDGESNAAGTDLADTAPEEAFDQEAFGVDGDLGSDVSALDGIDAGFVIEQYQASIAIAVACIVGFVALNLVRGRQGRVWQAVRDDPIAAAVTGISPSGSKVSAFVVSSLFAALSGAVFAQILSYVGPGAFSLGLSLSLLVGIVLGGRNSLIGAMIGAVILVWLPEFVLGLAADRGWDDQITNYAPNLIYGLLVVLVVLAVPGGLVGSIQSLGKRLTKS